MNASVNWTNVKCEQVHWRIYVDSVMLLLLLYTETSLVVYGYFKFTDDKKKIKFAFSHKWKTLSVVLRCIVLFLLGVFFVLHLIIENDNLQSLMAKELVVYNAMMLMVVSIWLRNKMSFSHPLLLELVEGTIYRLHNAISGVIFTSFVAGFVLSFTQPYKMDYCRVLPHIYLATLAMFPYQLTLFALHIIPQLRHRKNMQQNSVGKKSERIIMRNVTTTLIEILANVVSVVVIVLFTLQNRSASVNIFAVAVFFNMMCVNLNATIWNEIFFPYLYFKKVNYKWIMES